MNVLPLLLAAVAVLLAGAAFLKTLGSRGSADAEGAARREAALLELLGKLGGDVGAIRASLEGGADKHAELLDGLSAISRSVEDGTGTVRGLRSSLESLPDAMSRAVGASDLLGELRSVRSATGSVVDRVSSLQIELQSSGKSRDEGIASLGGEMGRKLSTIGEALAGLADGLGRESDSSRDRAAADAARMDALASSLASLPDRLGTIGAALEALDASGRESELARIQSESLEVQRSIAQVVASLERSAAEAAAARRESESLRGSAEASAAGHRAELVSRVSEVVVALEAVRGLVEALPVRTAEEVAARPSPAPELEELAIAVREAGSLRGDSVRSVADAVSRVAERLEASAEEGREAREDASRRLSESIGALEGVAVGVREALLPLGEALRGHGEAVIPVVRGLELAQDRLEEAGVSLRANQVEFAASVGVFSNAAQDLSSGLGAFAREGAEDGLRDPAAAQAALLESLDRLLGGFADSLRSTLVEADLRHREALAEIAARLPGAVPG